MLPPHFDTCEVCKAVHGKDLGTASWTALQPAEWGRAGVCGTVSSGTIPTRGCFCSWTSALWNQGGISAWIYRHDGEWSLPTGRLPAVNYHINSKHPSHTVELVWFARLPIKCSWEDGKTWQHVIVFKMKPKINTCTLLLGLQKDCWLRLLWSINCGQIHLQQWWVCKSWGKAAETLQPRNCSDAGSI